MSSAAEAYNSPPALEDRRPVRVVNPHATMNGNATAYLRDIQENTKLDIEGAPVVYTHKNLKDTWQELAKTLRPGDLIHAECGDGSQKQVAEFMADLDSPEDVVLMTSATGNAKNNHKAVVAKELWRRPSTVIKRNQTATVYPIRTEISQPEDEEHDLPAQRDVELAVAIASIGGVATGAAYLEGNKQRQRRAAIKRYMHDHFGDIAAEVATLIYDGCISARALPHIGHVEFVEHPNGLTRSVAEAFVNARDVAKIARINKADLLKPGFEYATIPTGFATKLRAIWQLLRINGTFPTETILPHEGQKLHFKLAPFHMVDVEIDGDPKKVRGGSTIDVDQVFWGDSRHRPIVMVVARQAIAA